ncbi:MAG TPA: response regulator [Polyangiaceae bacterium]|jgi:two-component system probable response regulator PhcQ|nr:response regulator [Polyangiaceae bacterium]
MATPAVVLFVDDEPAILEGFRDGFRREAYEVVTASSASSALQILAAREVDVVVSDECMPRVSGSEFLARVREQHPAVVRIMLTGEASLSAATRAINDGLYRFLSKPVEQEELRRVVRDALKIKGVAEQRARLRRSL